MATGTQRRRQIQPKSQPKPIYASNVSFSCRVCGVAKHPLYMCRRFKSLPCEQWVNTVRHENCVLTAWSPVNSSNNVSDQGWIVKSVEKYTTFCCTNLMPPSPGKVQLHPSLKIKKLMPPTYMYTSTHHLHLSRPKLQKQQWSVLLMMCQVMIMTSDGHKSQARALLDSVSSTSFVTEHLAQRLRLPQQCWYWRYNAWIQFAFSCVISCF